MSDLIPVKRWALLKDFNPLSHLQVKAYLRAKNYPIPKHRTERDAMGERKDTTNDESLTDLMMDGKAGFGDPVLAGILRTRHLSKALGYLSEKYVRHDGRFHPVYSYKPKQRLSSAGPNVMNFPKGAKGEVMKEASDAVLSSVVADEGFTLCSSDWNSLHPALIAFFADDPLYARQARLGDHANVLSHFLFLEGRRPAPVDFNRPDEVVKAELDTLKITEEADYKMAKIANLAYKYLQGEVNMAKTTGLSREKVKKLRLAIDQASPKVTAWKWKVLEKAHFEGRLLSPFGLPLTFFDIFKVKNGKVQLSRDTSALYPQGVPMLGSEAPEAVAFMPLSTESGMLREVLVSLGFHEENLNINPNGSFFLSIPEHDKIILQIKDSEVDRVLRTIVVPSMNRAWPELNGLRVGVDVETGRKLSKCPKDEKMKDGSVRPGCPWQKAEVCEAGHMKAYKL